MLGMKNVTVNPKKNYFKQRQFKMGVTFSFLGLMVILPFQNCAKQQLEFAQVESELRYALIYGTEPGDQELLAQRIQGNDSPTLNNIFNQWSRISGGVTYQKVSDIVREPEYNFCFTTLNSEGFWTPGMRPNGNVIDNPGLAPECLDSSSFSASSWSYISSSDSLRCGANSNNLVGFVSGIPFETYQNEATIYSDDRDDDMIGLIVASVVAPDGRIHTLSAFRSQGGNFLNAINGGWGFVYHIDGVINSVPINTSFDGVYSNDNSSIPANLTGWNGKRTLIRVNRDRDIVSAYTSAWSTNPNNLMYAEASRIELNLAVEGLEIFRGPQKYGYGHQSQSGATFQNIRFTSLVEVEFLYDLNRKIVYRLKKDGSGRYEVMRGVSPAAHLGKNVNVVNPETQRAFFLWSNSNFKEVEGDEIGEDF